MREPRVLCVSFDKVVSDSRAAALRAAGFKVTVTLRINKALDLLAEGEFDLVIIGHRFSNEDKYVLAVEAEEKSAVPVVLVCGISSQPEIPASARVYALEGNEGLVAAALALVPVKEGISRKAA